MGIEPFHEIISYWDVFHVGIWQVECLEQRSTRVDTTIVISSVLESIGTRYCLLRHVSTRQTF